MGWKRGKQESRKKGVKEEKQEKGVENRQIGKQVWKRKKEKQENGVKNMKNWCGKEEKCEKKG